MSVEPLQEFTDSAEATNALAEIRDSGPTDWNLELPLVLRLRAAGLVSTVWDGKTRFVHLTQRGRTALERNSTHA